MISFPKEKNSLIEFSSNVILFIKEVRPCPIDLRKDIMMSMNLFDPNDRFELIESRPGIKKEKYATEFTINKVYGCQVILTNSSISQEDISLLVEVPTGSIPVKSQDYSKSEVLSI